MNFLSVCSGIEAASVAFAPLNWRAIGFSEIESFACSLLAHHYPHIKNHGDINNYEKWDISRDSGAVDLVVGGTPCQDFSVAGKRAGIHGERSGLFWQYIGVLERFKPKWFVWENVPGVLSSGSGADYRTIINAFTQRGYGCVGRILDVQYVRVDGYVRAIPQRRRRLFVVGYFGDWRPAAAVLLESTSMCGYFAPRRQAGQGIAGTLTGGASIGSSHGKLSASDKHIIACNTAPSIPSRHSAGGGFGTDAECDGALIPCVSPTLLAKMAKGTGGPAGNECQNLISTFQNTGHGYWNDKDVAAPLRTPLGAASYESTVITQYGNVAGTITSEHDSSPCADRGTNILTCEARDVLTFKGGQGAKTRSLGLQSGCSPTIGSAQQSPCILENSQSPQIAPRALRVRRLTPLECERLFGFPDLYTAIPHRAKPASDSARYRALGNSMGVNVVRWIARRIELVEQILSKNISKAN